MSWIEARETFVLRMVKCPSRMSHKLDGERNWEYYQIIISLNELKNYMMVVPGIKYAGGKLLPRWDL